MVAQAPCGSVQLHTRLLVFQEDPKALARKAPEGWGRGLPLRLCKAQAVGPGMCFAMLRFFQQFERADWVKPCLPVRVAKAEFIAIRELMMIRP